jgi:hypothetical protein
VLQVAVFDPQNAVLNVAAAYALGTRLGMMTRLHVNMKAMRPALQTELLNLYFRNTHHQLEPWDLPDHELEQKLLLCDLIVQGPHTKPRLEERAEDVELLDDDPGTGMELAWIASGKRFLGGNFGRKTLAELESDPATAYLVAKVQR